MPKFFGNRTKKLVPSFYDQSTGLNTFVRGKIIATGQLHSDGFLLEKGSFIKKLNTLKSNPGVTEIRNELLSSKLIVDSQFSGYYQLVEDVLVPSANVAARLIHGNDRDASVTWKNGAGKSLGQLLVTPEFVPNKTLENSTREDLAEFENEVAPLEEIKSKIEGAKKERLTSYYERNAENRIRAIEIHKTKCIACGFDFEAVYGEAAAGFIEVHHLLPVSKFNGERPVNPQTDMTVLCANCHRMIHKLSRAQNKILSVEDLKQIIRANAEKKGESFSKDF